mmetsp:Transcript_69264/g.190143  ORF Transcript_69264/g.190143 Transcript_69264/m.190143 type:complete len:340 (+) Transcript_69264:104-1123(+)
MPCLNASDPYSAAPLSPPPPANLHSSRSAEAHRLALEERHLPLEELGVAARRAERAVGHEAERAHRARRVAREHVQQHVRAQVPHLHDAVAAAGAEHLAGDRLDGERVHGRRLGRVVARLERRHAHGGAVGHAPQPHAPVLRARAEQLRALGVDEARDRRVVRLPAEELAVLGRVPLPDALVGRAREDGAVGRGERVHRVRVPLEPGDESRLALKGGGRVPDADRVVGGGRVDVRRRRERAPDARRVALERRDARLLPRAVRAPHAHRAVVRAGYDVAAAHLDAVDVVGVAVEPTVEGPRVQPRAQQRAAREREEGRLPIRRRRQRVDGARLRAEVGLA